MFIFLFISLSIIFGLPVQDPVGFIGLANIDVWNHDNKNKTSDNGNNDNNSTNDINTYDNNDDNNNYTRLIIVWMYVKSNLIC